MNQAELINCLKRSRVVPIFDPTDKIKTLEIIDALIQGGALHIEITFRSPLAIEIFEIVREANTELVIGAGSIVEHQQYEIAKKLGADFTISPGFDKEFHEFVRNDELIHIPGISTASELIKARSHGAKIVKFYPAMAAGGYKTLRDLARIFPDMYFMPSGGITQNDLVGFAQIQNVISVGGSWMYQEDLKGTVNHEIKNKMKSAISMMHQ